MKKTIFIIIFNAALIILNTLCLAQNTNVDSLLTLLKKDKDDTSKVRHLNALGLILMYQNPDTAVLLANQALKIITPVSSAEFTSTKDAAGDNRVMFLRSCTFSTLGSCYYFKADYLQSLDYHLKSLKIREEINDKEGIAVSLCNIGNIYSSEGNYSKAFEFYFKTLKIDEELNDKNGIARALGNIGLVFSDQKDYPKALDYYFRALEIKEKQGNKTGISNTLGNIGIVYYELKDYQKALKYYFKALKIAEEIGYKNGIASDIGNIGTVYDDMKDYPNALKYYFEALKLTEELGDKSGMAANLGDIGALYTSIGKFKEAEFYIKKSIVIDDSIGSLDGLMHDEEALSQLYDTTNRYRQALIHYKKSISLKDTLFSQENKKQLIRKEMNYDFDKKEAATKAENEKQQAVAIAESKKQKIIILSVVGGLLLVIVFAGFIFRSLQITRRQKKIIELQKDEVLRQKEIVEKQKEKITDSITYAQRIQQSILMEESEVQNYLPESFIYFQPKDIVSGDFYWCSKLNGKIVIAAVDCTGHGVPGAFMSMIGNTLLNQIVNEKQITKPSEILRLLNLGVYEALHQKKYGALSDDGMDIALCCIDYDKKEVQYAGQNPLYVLTDGQLEITKGDIYGIGGGGMIAKMYDPLKKEFANHVIPIKEDMSIYIFSDGYNDQFGGSDRKKFGTQKFKELLLNIRHLGMKNQKEIIASAHNDWKGNTLQIDDILVIGIKI